MTDDEQISIRLISPPHSIFTFKLTGSILLIHDSTSAIMQTHFFLLNNYIIPKDARPESSLEIPYIQILDATFNIVTRTLQVSFISEKRAKKYASLSILEGIVDDLHAKRASDWAGSLMSTIYDGMLSIGFFLPNRFLLKKAPVSSDVDA